jgi:hypothetical protein
MISEACLPQPHAIIMPISALKPINTNSQKDSNRTWLNTTDNYYVSETGLADPINRFTLDNRVAIGLLQAKSTGDYDLGVQRGLEGIEDHSTICQL